MITNIDYATFSSPLTTDDYWPDPNNPGYVAPNHVVASLVDSFDSADDASALSVREAANGANGNMAVDQVWLPPWQFLLTRVRRIAPNEAGPLVSEGDIEVDESLVLRAAGSGASYRWHSESAADKVFDLLGDYNNDRVNQGTDIVNSAEYTVWRDTLGFTGPNLAADGDDDGDVDAADYQIWQSHFGNTLRFYAVFSS